MYRFEKVADMPAIVLPDQPYLIQFNRVVFKNEPEKITAVPSPIDFDKYAAYCNPKVLHRLRGHLFGVRPVPAEYAYMLPTAAACEFDKLKAVPGVFVEAGLLDIYAELMRCTRKTEGKGVPRGQMTWESPIYHAVKCYLEYGAGARSLDELKSRLSKGVHGQRYLLAVGSLIRCRDEMASLAAMLPIKV